MERIETVISALGQVRGTRGVGSSGLVTGTIGRGGRSDTVPEQDRFTVLKNERRRQALRVLAREDGATTLSGMAERIAGWENGIDPALLEAQQRKRVYVALYQRHLPRMDEIGVVEFERRSGRVRLTECGRRLWDWCKRTRNGTPTGAADSWPKRYLTVGVSGVVGLVIATAGGYPSVWSTTAILAATLLISLAHLSTPPIRPGGPRSS